MTTLSVRLAHQVCLSLVKVPGGAAVGSDVFWLPSGDPAAPVPVLWWLFCVPSPLVGQPPVMICGPVPKVEMTQPEVDGKVTQIVAGLHQRARAMLTLRAATFGP